MSYVPPGFGEDGVNGYLGSGVGGDLIGSQDGFKLTDQIGGGDDLLAEGAEEFDGSGIDEGDGGEGVIGGILHGQAMGGGEHGIEGGG